MRELGQCLLAGRGACGQYIGFALLIGLVFLIIAAALTAWRMRRGTSPRAALWRSGLEAALVVELGGILFLTLSLYAPGAGGAGSLNLVPFQELVASSGDAFYFRLALFDLVGNVMLYVPLGLLVALRLNQLRIWQWAPLVVALALGIEVTQAFVLDRAGDLTDVITNCSGGLAGFLIGRVAQRLADSRQSRFGPTDQRG